jgi:putative flippase GtrA
MPLAPSSTIAIRYVLFAAIATMANLAAQEAVIQLAPPAALALSIGTGTVVGFAVKYVLDKKWIFFDHFTSHREEARKLSLYGLFSIVTTLIFWGFEVAFWTIWRTDVAKYAGAVLGLAIGYVAKFMLDGAFTFRERNA